MTIFKPLCVNTSGVAKNKLLPQDVYGIRRTPWPPSPLLRVRLNLRGACCALRFERHGEARERLGELPGPMRAWRFLIFYGVINTLQFTTVRRTSPCTSRSPRQMSGGQFVLTHTQ